MPENRPTTAEPTSSDVELFTIDQIQKAYDAWQAGDVPQTFPEMMRESGWFMAGKQSRAGNPIATLHPNKAVSAADPCSDKQCGERGEHSYCVPVSAAGESEAVPIRTVEAVARAVSEVGGAANWDHALEIAIAAITALREHSAQSGDETNA